MSKFEAIIHFKEGFDCRYVHVGEHSSIPEARKALFHMCKKTSMENLAYIERMVIVHKLTGKIEVEVKL
jgi:hypothetical protein